jgi:hypothetical protein
MWEPRRLTTLLAFTACYRDNFTYIKMSSSLDDVMSSIREDVIRRRHVLLRCVDSSLNHEWSKTASFVSCLDACLDAVGVRPPLQCLSHAVASYCLVSNIPTAVNSFSLRLSPRLSFMLISSRWPFGIPALLFAKSQIWISVLKASDVTEVYRSIPHST